MTDSRVLRYARLFNYGDCYSGIYWADVFDGTYDQMHPEGRWFDPIGIWTQRYFDLIHRPADPGALHDPVLRELFLQTILDSGHTLDEVTEKALAAFARDLFILLRSEAHNALEVLPEHVFVLYRELVHTDPAPSDEELIAFWTAHIPNYVEFYRSICERWRIEAIDSLRHSEQRRGRAPDPAEARAQEGPGPGSPLVGALVLHIDPHQASRSSSISRVPMTRPRVRIVCGMTSASQ